MMIAENLTQGVQLGDRIEVADTLYRRSRGLLGRSCLSTGQGLWIVPCRSIHTLFMNFPIDVCFLSKNLEVLKVQRSLHPWNLAFAPAGTRSVLELPAGVLRRTGVQVTDKLAIRNDLD